MNPVIKFIVTSFFIFVFGFSQSIAQVGIGTTSPSPNSVLDINSTSGGLLIPRMTTLQRLAITPNATTDRGLLVYDTDTNSLWHWNGTFWVEIVMAITGDESDDAWVNNVANSRIEIASKSDGVMARDAGTEVVVLDNGNVGIGTTAPATSFQVRNDGTPGVVGSEQLRLSDNGAGNALLSLNTLGQKAGYIGVDRATESMYFTNANLFSQNTLGDAHMVISTNGNVGIGTTSPTAQLEINSGMAGTSGLKFTSVNASTTPTAGAAGLGVDDSGNVVLVGGATQVARIRLNGTATGTSQEIPLSYAVVNINTITGSTITAGSNSLVLPPGLYKLTGNVNGAFNAAQNSNYFDLRLYINNSPFQTFAAYSTAGSNGGIANGSAVFELTATSTIQFRIFCQVGGGNGFVAYNNNNSALIIERLN